MPFTNLEHLPFNQSLHMGLEKNWMNLFLFRGEMIGQMPFLQNSTSKSFVAAQGLELKNN